MSGDPAEALWEIACSSTESEALGKAINNMLGTLPRDRQLALDEVLDDGAYFVLLHEHNGKQKTEIYLAQDGKYSFFAKLALAKPIHH
jgi:hypothetical protein